MTIFSRQVSARFTQDTKDGVTRTEVSGLHMEFRCSRTVKAEPSTLELDMYNLAEDTRKSLEEYKNTVVTLNVGYEGQTFDLYTGDVTTVRTRREGSNIITTVEAGDGAKGGRRWLRKHYPKNTKLLTVLEGLAKAAGFGRGNIRKLVGTVEARQLPATIKNGITICGYAHDELNELCQSRGLEYSIQNNEVQVTKAGEAVPGTPVIELSPTSGLIGVPTVDQEGILDAEAALIPGIFPGSKVKITSEFVTGAFRVLRADYNGSVDGSVFSVAIEGQKLK